MTAKSHADQAESPCRRSRSAARCGASAWRCACNSSTLASDPSRITAPAALEVISCRVPNATPTVACSIAGASLRPSPTNNVGWRRVSSSTIATFSSGLFSVCTCVMRSSLSQVAHFRLAVARDEQRPDRTCAADDRWPMKGALSCLGDIAKANHAADAVVDEQDAFESPSFLRQCVATAPRSSLAPAGDLRRARHGRRRPVRSPAARSPRPLARALRPPRGRPP